MLEWVFFDVGNCLFDDDSQGFLAWRHYFEAFRARRADLTFEDILAERERRAKEGHVWVLRDVAKDYLTEDEIDATHERLRRMLHSAFDENHLPNRGVPELLHDLAGRYRLGIIANQPGECRAALERRGWLSLFEVVAISEEIDLHKPSPDLYRWALREAGCLEQPERTVMIGDRRDNDVEPAKAVGMRTIWVAWQGNASKVWRPTSPLAKAYLASCERTAPFSVPPTPANEPDRTVADLTEVPAVLASLDRHDAGAPGSAGPTSG